MEETMNRQLIKTHPLKLKVTQEMTTSYQVSPTRRCTKLTSGIDQAAWI